VAFAKSSDDLFHGSNIVSALRGNTAPPRLGIPARDKHRQMPNGMRQRKRFADLAKQHNGFLIALTV
jgi:hypothetical protein